MLDRLLLAYSSGLIGAISPCVLVLIPLCLVRFIRPTNPKRDHTQKDQSTTHQPTSISLPVELFQFLIGFQSSYILFGYLLAEVLTSNIQNGFKVRLLPPSPYISSSLSLSLTHTSYSIFLCSVCFSCASVLSF